MIWTDLTEQEKLVWAAAFAAALPDAGARQLAVPRKQYFEEVTNRAVRYADEIVETFTRNNQR